MRSYGNGVMAARAITLHENVDGTFGTAYYVFNARGKLTGTVVKKEGRSQPWHAYDARGNWVRGFATLKSAALKVAR